MPRLANGIKVSVSAKIPYDLHLLLEKKAKETGETISELINQSLSTTLQATNTDFVPQKLSVRTFELIDKATVCRLGSLKVYVSTQKKLVFFVKQGQGSNKDCWEYERFPDKVWDYAIASRGDEVTITDLELALHAQNINEYDTNTWTDTLKCDYAFMFWKTLLDTQYGNTEKTEDMQKKIVSAKDTKGMLGATILKEIYELLSK